MLPVLLSFTLYALYVLLPLIPATVIYKNFPDTSVAVSGPLSKFSVRASGAFAAYVVTVLLGFTLVTETQSLIRSMRETTWTVISDVELYDRQGNAITGPERDRLLELINVTIDPSRDNPADGRVYVETSIDPSDPPVIIYEIPQFGQARTRLGRDNVDFDHLSHEAYSKPIEIEQTSGQDWKVFEARPEREDG